MTLLGLAITAATVLILLIEFLRHRQTGLPAYGWAGIVVLSVAEILLFKRLEPIPTYFTPIAWTSYILTVDAAVFSIRGRSRLRDAPREFLQTALLSIPLWLIFEAYNLRLANWTYVGVPGGPVELLLGYAWAFATITPGIFETADLIESFGWFRPAGRLRLAAWSETTMALLGAACLILPLVVPKAMAEYLFALVWIGFVLLLDPINRHLGWPSLLSDLVRGRTSRFSSLLLSGWVCGWLWEFWNYWASAKWHYIFPIMQGSKIFEMPAIGYLGFLPFALECFVMYVTAAQLVGAIRLAREAERAKG
ncbi:MAG: hypothetical protein JO249_14830 [Acidobacteria bacterium]|nr:hypothetical protein [Acidobacteriota bacterium]